MAVGFMCWVYSLSYLRAVMRTGPGGSASPGRLSASICFLLPSLSHLEHGKHTQRALLVKFGRENSDFGAHVTWVQIPALVPTSVSLSLKQG